MESALTTCILLLALASVFRGLRHGLYILHIALVAACTFCVQAYLPQEIEEFSLQLLIVILVFHMLSINIVTYIAYFIDKRASRRGGWRVAERTLHHLAFVGGTPAALIAQKLLRHKTKKQSFRAVFWFIAILQSVALLSCLILVI